MHFMGLKYKRCLAHFYLINYFKIFIGIINYTKGAFTPASFSSFSLLVRFVWAGENAAYHYVNYFVLLFDRNDLLIILMIIFVVISQETIFAQTLVWI